MPLGHHEKDAQQFRASLGQQAAHANSTLLEMAEQQRARLTAMLLRHCCCLYLSSYHKERGQARLCNSTRQGTRPAHSTRDDSTAASSDYSPTDLKNHRFLAFKPHRQQMLSALCVRASLCQLLTLQRCSWPQLQLACQEIRQGAGQLWQRPVRDPQQVEQLTAIANI